ncbi:MAG TPA: glycerophosphodiester phosphodiesterase [Chryseosolibacter sp.]
MSRAWVPISIIVIVSLCQCERVEYFPDNPITDATTRVLAHKGGGGSFGEGNTLEACVYGLERLDGIEVDLQKSEDNVLWLGHASDVPGCGAFPKSCFAGLTSSTIVQIDSCLGKTINFTKLETVFDYASKHHPDKYLSLDVKAWSPCEFNDINITREMNQLAAEIILLTSKYGLENRVMVESETGDFLYYVKTHSDFIETYLTTLGDFELGAARALDAGFSGISYEFRAKENLLKEQVDLLHRKGLKIQVWTIYDSQAFEEAKSLGVDFIQTDDI